MQVREATTEFLGLSGEKPNLSSEKLDSSGEKPDPPVETKEPDHGLKVASTQGVGNGDPSYFETHSNR